MLVVGVYESKERGVNQWGSIFPGHQHCVTAGIRLANLSLRFCLLALFPPFTPHLILKTACQFMDAQNPLP